MNDVPKKPENKPIVKSKTASNKVVPENYIEKKPLLNKKPTYKEDKIEPKIDTNEMVKVIEDFTQKRSPKQEMPTQDSSKQEIIKAKKEAPIQELIKNKPKTPEQKPPGKKYPLEKKSTENVKPSSHKMEEPVMKRQLTKQQSKKFVNTLESELKKTLVSDISGTDLGSSMGSSSSGSTYTGSSGESESESVSVRPKTKTNQRS